MILYKPGFIPSKIFIVGAGGIGSRLAPLVTQFCSKMVRHWLPSLEIYIVDPDIVEEKNLMRQNFISQDVGSSKAFTLAQRYGSALEFPIIPVQKRFSEFAKEEHPYFDNSLILLCLDSKEARIDSLRAIRIRTAALAPIIVDGGNENTFGQIHICNAVNFLSEALRAKVPTIVLDKGRYISPYLNFDYEFYLDSPAAQANGISCADLDQTLAINSMVATGMMGFVQNIFFRQPFNYNIVRYDLNYGVSTQFLSFLNIFGKARTGDHRALVHVAEMTRSTAFPELKAYLLSGSVVPDTPFKEILGPLSPVPTHALVEEAIVGADADGEEEDED